MENKPKGGKRQGSGRKPKSGEYVQFRPSVEVWDILKQKPNRTAFIEESIIKWELHNQAVEEILNKD
jgi:hypothetical protein